MADKFQSFAAGLTAPASNAFPVTPQDGVDLPAITRALYVGGSGDVAATMTGGEAIILVNVLAGTVLPVRLARVAATGTTAQNLVGLY